MTDDWMPPEHDLAPWLLEQIDVDERRARMAGNAPSPSDFSDSRGPGMRWRVIAPRDSELVYVAGGEPPECVWDISENSETWAALGEHIALWDPERVLAECAAKRRRIALHKADPNGDCTTCVNPGTREEFSEWWNPETYPCPTLRIEALPMADRPGYREQWRP